MVIASSPAVPPYRITLFFGPDVRDRDPDVVYCVFNVKKRSWKGGVQCVVEMTQAQVASCRRILRVDAWLRNALRQLPREERDRYTRRGRELCLQSLCRTKLHLAVTRGLTQDTTLVPHDKWAQELDEAVRRTAHEIKAGLLDELDVPRAGDDTEAATARAVM